MRFLITAALIAVSASGALAQTTVTPEQKAKAEAAAKALAAADANKDGKWDKAEWLAAGRRERGFQMLDADSDGFVSQAELKDGMAKMQARRAGAPETN